MFGGNVQQHGGIVVRHMCERLVFRSWQLGVPILRIVTAARRLWELPFSIHQFVVRQLLFAA